ncbi:ABC transporter substrate-binding protein [Parasedimentitalea maritima]|uniref:ABC transporter substrate-binding protein n=1 Tax=Parasedimentitalea maritima TaxID=2578117 RepID=A0ABY2UVD3_9RHOB|nr:ABC transporter substrate-binding protein [Zongyanglinia marina]TLP65601.1 ABC transporter substrate-binding protein [Zongyanglinia marina]
MSISKTKSTRMSRRAFLGYTSALSFAAVLGQVHPVQAAEPVKGGHFVLGLKGGESTNSLDPALSASQVPFNILRGWGESLLNVAPDGGLEYRLAESVEATDDGQSWHFTIRSGVKFHNGETMTAQDVLKTMERHSNEDSKSGALGIMRGIESMSVEGSVFTVNLTTASSDLPYLLADYHLVIQPNGGMDDPTAGIGTGPYKITENEPGARHGFEKFADYWDDSRGHYDTYEIIVINDDTARAAALQSGQVNAINIVSPKTAKLFGRAPGISIETTSGRGHYVFVMHVDTPPFDNKDLRLALKYAVNREEMVEKVLNGYGAVGNDTPINDAYPLFDETIPQRQFDLDKAREHYAASGHDGSPIVLRVSDAAFAGALDAAALFQQSAQAAGIPLEIKREPADGYWSEVWNKQPFAASYWGGRAVQDQMYTTAYLSTADWNDTRFKNADFDDLLLQARAELDENKRKDVYGQMGRLLNEEGGLINPMFNQFIDGVSAKVAGWEANPNAEMMDGFIASKTWFE